MTNPRDDLITLAERVEKVPAYSGRDLCDAHLFRIDDTDKTNLSGVKVFLIDAASRTIIVDALRLAASRPAPVDREAVERALIETLPGVGKPSNKSVRDIAVDRVLSLLRPAEPVEAKWRPIETAPKEDPERPGRDFEIIVGGGEIKDESADLLPWRPFDSWSLACYDSMRGCWRGEQTEQYDCFYLHKPTHWMPKFAGPGQCEPTTSDAVGEPVAASPYEGKMIVDAKLLHALWCYGNLHVVEGVIYSPGSHQECLAQVNALFRERATHPPASPDTSAAILAERERCAAIADEWANKMALNYGRETANTIAAAIRQLPTTERGE